ncbi:MAG: hypothetical protein J6W56_12050 [Prevotella sp.]|nr:hypothetical protein [Prevotella sp.]
MNQDQQEKESQLLKSRSGRACIREGYQLFTSHFRRIFRHTWPVALCFAILSAAAAALPVMVSPTYLLPALGIEIVAVILLLVITYKRLVKKQLFERLPKDRKPFAWLRHLGMVTLVWLFCLIVVLSLSVITTLPMLIIMAASWLNNVGILTGDPNGMPDYMTWLSIIVFLIAGFIQAYLWLTILCPVYLMRGSIAQQEKERAELKAKALEESKPKEYVQNLIYRP